MGHPGTPEPLDPIHDLLQDLRQALEETNRLLEALAGSSGYKRPQDTTVSAVRCRGSKGSPESGSQQTWGTNGGGPRVSGLCPSCGRRIRLYTNGMLAVHKRGT